MTSSFPAVLLLLWATAAAAEGGEFFGSSTPCAEACPSDTAKFSYKDGIVHVFDYFSMVKFLGDDKVPQIGISSRAHITVVSKCEMILTVNDVKSVDGSSPSLGVYAKFGQDLQRNPLRFAFHDGTIMSVCPAKDEPLWALNYKRAILSTFQNSMEKLNSKLETVNEEDVAGSCMSTYQSESKEKDIYNITRSRDPAACTAPQAPPTDQIGSQVLQKLPLVAKEQKCLQIIANGKLKESSCRENIRSSMCNKEDEPRVQVTTSLKHVYEYVADFVIIPTYEASRQHLPIQWENTTDDVAPPNWLSVAHDLIEHLSGQRPSPEDFFQLMELLKLFNYGQLNDLFVTLEPQYWDNTLMAIIQLGTEPSLRLMKDFIASHVTKVKDGLEHLANTRDISHSLIKMMQDTDMDYILKTQLKDYCVQNPSCYDDSNIIKKFEDLSYMFDSIDCTIVPDNISIPFDDMTEEQSSKRRLVERNLNNARRSLQNWSDLGFFNKSLASNITQCVSQKHYKNLRFQALDTLRNVPCSWYNSDDLLKVAQESQSEDSLFDTMMYMTLIRCPTTNISEYIKQRLQKGLNQETSFIWTHLKNMNNAFSKQLINEANVHSVYQRNPKKFSRNIVKDIKLLDKNFQIESNVVFDEQQIAPKYACVNVWTENKTMELFDIEIQERKDDVIGINEYKYEHHHRMRIRVKGKTVFNDNIDLRNAIMEISDVPIAMMSIGFFYASVFTLRFWTSIFSDEIPLHFTSKDLNLYYPTSVGMPLHIKVNKTMGTYTNEQNFESYYHRQMDASVMLDATHTNIGTNFRISSESIPTSQVHFTSDSIEIVADFPTQSDVIYEMNVGLNNIENHRVTPRHQKKMSAAVKSCLPPVNIFASQLCYSYSDNAYSWPISKLQYRLLEERNPKVTGEKLKLYSNDVSSGYVYEHIGGDKKYALDIATLGQFGSFKLECPSGKINGTGIYYNNENKDDGRYLCLNVSGHYETEKKSSPFSILGYTTIEKAMDKKVFEASMNCSDYAAALRLQGVSNRNLTRADGSLAYRPQEARQQQHIYFGYKGFDVRNETHSGYSGSVYMNTTEWPNTKTNMMAEYIRERNRKLWQLEALSDLSCSEYMLRCSLEGSGDGNKDSCKAETVLQGPHFNVTVHKHMERDNFNFKMTKSVKRDGEKCYDMAAAGGMLAGGLIYGNLSLDVPQTNKTAPLFAVHVTKKIDLPRRILDFTADFSYQNYSTLLNITHGPADRSKDMFALAVNQDKHYVSKFELQCDQYGEFSVNAGTKLSNKLQNFDFTVDVVTPFKRWDEPKMKMVIKKHGGKFKAIMEKQKKGYEVRRYEFDASSDYDIATNLIL